MEGLQLKVPFTDDEYASILVPSKKVIQSKSIWYAQKATLGILRHDLTKDLLKTEHGMPIVKAYTGDLPAMLVDFNSALKCGNPNAWLHGFSDDVILDRGWHNPQLIFSRIPINGGLVSLDFSMRLDMAEAELIYNTFRRNAFAQMGQNCGYKVIAAISWANALSLEYAFDGIEPGGIYAISNIGTMRHPISRKIFKMGVVELVRRLNPRCLIIYGYELDFDCGVKTVVFQNPNLLRLHNLRK